MDTSSYVEGVSESGVASSNPATHHTSEESRSSEEAPSGQSAAAPVVSSAPVHHSIATPAMKLICAVGDWPNNDIAVPVSQLAFVQLAFGYKYFVEKCVDQSTIGLSLRSSDDRVVEIQSLIAYPDRKGNGSSTMRRLCALADNLGVTLWLDAYPFGRNRAHIPIGKLKALYRRFGFVAVRNVSTQWKSGFHRWNRAKFCNLMIRLPKSVTISAI